ncbi:MAG: hypothetical protein NTY48_07195, partial [Candidatus Diapherotrites archaeon]|nr:hypothetical protein [Candidatus Diapherotrites archaeon]
HSSLKAESFFRTKPRFAKRGNPPERLPKLLQAEEQLKKDVSRLQEKLKLGCQPHVAQNTKRQLYLRALRIKMLLKTHRKGAEMPKLVETIKTLPTIKKKQRPSVKTKKRRKDRNTRLLVEARETAWTYKR